jgi:hypothetical protein
MAGCYPQPPALSAAHRPETVTIVTAVTRVPEDGSEMAIKRPAARLASADVHGTLHHRGHHAGRRSPRNR